MDPRDLFRPAELARQHAFLCRLARELLGDAARAEDVVQDAYVLALARPPRAAGALSSWLGRVVRRLSLNELRRAERVRFHERAAARPELQGSHAEATASLDAQQRVLAAVRALEEPYRTALWMRYHEGLLPGAIAAREGVPVKTVKTRLARGLAQLRAELERAGGDGREAWAALLLPLARSAGVPGLVGGTIAMKKLVLAFGLVAVALVGWGVRERRERSAAAERAAAGPALVAAAKTEDAAEQALPATTAREALATGAESSGSEHAAAGATLAVHATWARDGSDAAGVGLVLLPLEHPSPDLAASAGRTDASGRATFAGMTPGSFTLLTDREGRERVALAAGETLALELAIAPGVDVSGRVVDGEGSAVGGAEIWLGRTGGPAWLAGEVVALADGAGRFFLRSVGAEQSLGALAPGFAPAWLVQLAERTWPADDPRIEVTLVLDEPGAALEGRVSDASGAPVAGARVGIGSSGVGIVRRADGGYGTRPRARAAVTDDAGRFRFDGVEPGTTPVNVLAEGFAPGRVDAEATAGNTAFVDVRLARGATIAGTVRDPSGELVAGAVVRVLRAGPVDSATPFSTQQATASADGAFRLDGVPAGEVTLRARHPSVEFLRARATRSLVEGTAESWDLVLTEEPHLRGRAEDGSGRPLAGWEVAAHEPDDGGGFAASRAVDTGADGRFVVPVSDPARPWTVELLHAGAVHHRVEDVRPGDEVVLIGLAPEDLGTLTGGFSDVAGRVGPGERVTAMLLPEARELFLAALSADVLDGRFAFAELTPGRYRVQVRTPGAVVAESAVVELAPGAHADVGVLASLAAGSLVVELTAPPGVVLPDAGAYVDFDRPLARAGAEWRMAALDPGPHWLSAHFAGLAMLQRSFVIEEGRETRLAVTLERGVERTLVLAPPPGVPCSSASLLLRADGWELALPVFGAERLELALTLGPGRYTVEATAAGGLRAEGVLEIGDLSVPEAEITYELR